MINSVKVSDMATRRSTLLLFNFFYCNLRTNIWLLRWIYICFLIILTIQRCSVNFTVHVPWSCGSTIKLWKTLYKIITLIKVSSKTNHPLDFHVGFNRMAKKFEDLERLFQFMNETVAF